MTQTDYEEIYISVGSAYQQLDIDYDFDPTTPEEIERSRIDEQIKSMLGDILALMIQLRKHNLITD